MYKVSRKPAHFLYSNKKSLETQDFTAADGTRTRDLLTTNEVRYHLCHASLLALSPTWIIYYKPIRSVKRHFQSKQTRSQPKKQPVSRQYASP